MALILGTLVAQLSFALSAEVTLSNMAINLDQDLLCHSQLYKSPPPPLLPY